MSFDKDDQLERDGAYEMGWEFPPLDMCGPAPAGEAEQLSLLPSGPRPVGPTERERRVGLAGVRRAKEAARRR